jgi:hypothetical protein
MYSGKTIGDTMTQRTHSHLRLAVSFGTMLSLFACVAQEGDVRCSDLPMPERISSPTCVPPDASVPTPTVTFPSWSTDHDQTQTVQVVPGPGWAVDLVEYSVGTGEWQKASSTGGGYQVILTDLDISDNAIAVRVTSSYRGVTEVNLYYSTITGVKPVFDCVAASMLPEATLVENNGTETRTLVGYFGDAAKHTVTATVGYQDMAGNQYRSVGTISNYGRNSITASFNVSHANCDTGGPPPVNNPFHDCDVPYTLSVSVDGGADLCGTGTFAQIHYYWTNRP